MCALVIRGGDHMQEEQITSYVYIIFGRKLNKSNKITQSTITTNKLHDVLTLFDNYQTLLRVVNIILYA